MDWERLSIAEERFFERYPGGFEHPEIVEIAKKHRGNKMTSRAQEVFAPDNFEDSEKMAEDIIKTVTMSSMVSVFEKPKFRDFVRSLPAVKRARLCSHLYQILHGDMEKGFGAYCDALAEGKLAKWTLMTICTFYYKPQEEVFVKPTTAKNVIRYFNIRGLEYAPRPSWEFYTGFRSVILEMRSRVSPLLGPDNAAFTGFLMMAMEGV